MRFDTEPRTEAALMLIVPSKLVGGAVVGGRVVGATTPGSTRRSSTVNDAPEVEMKFSRAMRVAVPNCAAVMVCRVHTLAGELMVIEVDGVALASS